MVPWTVYIGESLPSRQSSPHYDVAWAGFDVILLLALAATGYTALRRSRYLAMAATATAVLLVVDAWFDLMTTPSAQITQSIVLAALVELPLAVVCGWLGLHTEELNERRIVLLMRRRRRRPPVARGGFGTFLRMLALISAPSNLGLRPPQPGSVPGTAKAPEALREAGLHARLAAARAVDAGVVLPGPATPTTWAAATTTSTWPRPAGSWPRSSRPPGSARPGPPPPPRRCCAP